MFLTTKELNYKLITIITRKTLAVWKLNTYPNNQEVKAEITRNIR